MNNKVMILALMSSLTTSAMEAESNQTSSITINPKTGKPSFLQRQMALNRSRENDPHITLPWFNNDQKLQVNVAQAIHLLGLGATIYSMNPRMEAIVVAQCWGAPAPALDLNRYNLGASALLLYRFIAGEEKWPFRVVNAPEQTTLETKEEKDDANV